MTAPLILYFLLNSQASDTRECYIKLHNLFTVSRRGLITKGIQDIVKSNKNILYIVFVRQTLFFIFNKKSFF